MDHWDYKEPLNLTNYYKYFMRNHALDRRANSLKLKPSKRNTNPRCKVIIEPSKGIGNTVQAERIRDCIDQRNGMKVRG